jgi:hypothetical protein
VIEFTAEAILKGKQPAMSERVDPGPVARVQMAPEKMWERPDAGCVKLNVDINFLRTEGTAGAGMIKRDSDGGIIFSVCLSLQFCNMALEAVICTESIALAM